MPPATVGAVLRTRREELKLAPEDISAKTKVALRFLTAIENDAHDQLPPLSYSLGFVRLYAEAVGLDSGAVASQFKREAVAASTAPSPEGELPDHNVIRKTIPVWLPLAVAGLIIIILFAYFGWLRSTPPATTPTSSQTNSRPAATETAK